MSIEIGLKIKISFFSFRENTACFDSGSLRSVSSEAEHVEVVLLPTPNNFLLLDAGPETLTFIVKEASFRCFASIFQIFILYACDLLFIIFIWWCKIPIDFLFLKRSHVLTGLKAASLKNLVEIIRSNAIG